jgi:hypothetical protein
MWYPDMLMGWNFGICAAQNAMMSPTARMLGFGG